jgi:hypothetical protein
MTAANDCDLVRVYVTTPPLAPQNIADDSVKSNQTFNVVVEAEAGSALFAIGGPYKLQYSITDINNATAVTTANQGGTFGDANWPTPKMEFVFPPVAAQGAGKQDHVYDVTGVVSANQADPIVEFAKNEFIIIKP